MIELPSSLLDDTGATPDFAAKVRWRMQHDRNSLLPVLQDKVAVKRYAHERGLSTPRMLYVTNDPASIPFDALPNSYFIKANHGSGWNFLCEGGEFYYFGSGKDLVDTNGRLIEHASSSELHIPRETVVSMCKKMLGMRFAPQEWAYQVIEPQVLVEEVLHASDGGELCDFRFYVFDGVVRVINVGSATYRKRGENVFLTPDWEPIALTQYYESLPDPLPERPEKLAEMIAAAERLGKGIDFIRADLYQTTRGVMLGEITLYPGGGLVNSPTTCPRFNRWLGNFWNHPGHATAQWD